MRSTKHGRGLDRLDELLRASASDTPPLPEHNPRVDAFIQETVMKFKAAKMRLSRTAIGLIVVGVLGASAVTAAVSTEVFGRRAVVVTEDGKRYDIELLESPEGASGTFVTDDGTVYGVEMLESADRTDVKVEIDSPTGGMSTVEFDNGAKSSILVAPGQKASVQMSRKAKPSSGEEAEDAEKANEDDDSDPGR